MTRFRKMHGLGNDFAVFDARNAPLRIDATRARAIGDRHRGIGCDQIIIIEKSAKADAFMRIYNSDGGEVESCGNAARCIARILMDEKKSDSATLDTLGGMLSCSRAGENVTVDMGAPHLDWREIPMAQAVDTQSFALDAANEDFTPLKSAAAVSMGNPHCVLFVDDADKAPVHTLGPKLEHHAWFPRRANIEFVSRAEDGSLRTRVWERGAGITDACGTGACAVAVAAYRRGISPRSVRVMLDGGALDIEYRESDDHVLMTGPVALSFEGDVDLDKIGLGSLA